MKLLIALAFLSLNVANAKTTVVAVIDSGIDGASPNHLCKHGHKSFSTRLTDPLKDEEGHGTHIAGIISSTAGDGDYCIVSIKYYDSKAQGKENGIAMIKSIQYAVNIKVDFINISGGGPEPSHKEYAAVLNALNKNIRMIVAAGNEHENLDNLCNYYPACYDKRIVMVGNLQVNKDKFDDYDNNIVEPCPSSNYGKRVTRWEIGTDVLSTLPGGKKGYMTGTSQATAVATGLELREVLKK